MLFTSIINMINLYRNITPSKTEGRLQLSEKTKAEFAKDYLSLSYKEIQQKYNISAPEMNCWAVKCGLCAQNRRERGLFY